MMKVPNNVIELKNYIDKKKNAWIVKRAIKKYINRTKTHLIIYEYNYI